VAILRMDNDIRRRFALAICAVVLGCWISAPSAGAAIPFVDIGTPSGPLTTVAVGNDLSCQVKHTGDTDNEFYPRNVTPGDCGTFVAVAGKLFGPDFANHDSSSAGSVRSGAYTPFATTSQSAKTGAGTTASPFKVVTTASAPGSGLTIAQVDTYVAGQESYRTDVAVQNGGGAAQTITVYRAGDCYLQNSDRGAGFSGPNNAVGCSANPNNSPPGRIEQFVPITGGNNFLEANYSDVWSAIAAMTPFSNMCARCTETIDNGAGISWTVTIQPGQSASFSHYTTFSPTGQAGPPPPPSTQNVPPDLTAAATPRCLSIPPVLRNVVATVPGTGKVTLLTRQVDNPANPLRLNVRVQRGGIRSVQYIVNGRTVAVSVGSGGSAVVSVVWLRLGSRFVNRATAVVVLSSGVRVTLVQKMVILQCRAPAAFCKRVTSPLQLRCTANTPLSGRKVNVTVTGGAGQRATGSANAANGKYTVTVRSRTPLGPGTYAYKAVVRSATRGTKFQSLRRVTVR
jgi:hypothetical protein